MVVGVLTSSEIDSILKRCDMYSGTFASDSFRLTSQMRKQACIINTDISSAPGSHWVAIINDQRSCHFFDSFGLPIYTAPILKTLKENKIKTTVIIAAKSSRTPVITVVIIVSPLSYHTWLGSTTMIF